MNEWGVVLAAVVWLWLLVSVVLCWLTVGHRGGTLTRRKRIVFSFTWPVILLTLLMNRRKRRGRRHGL